MTRAPAAAARPAVSIAMPEPHQNNALNVSPTTSLAAASGQRLNVPDVLSGVVKDVRHTVSVVEDIGSGRGGGCYRSHRRAGQDRAGRDRRDDDPPDAHLNTFPMGSVSTGG